MNNFDFDVFLSHNKADKAVVERLASQLENSGLKVWLDRWNLVPGDAWQDEIEEALDRSRTVAVFVGPSGIGGWHNEEMRSALETRVVDRNRRVIPVLLPGAAEPDKKVRMILLNGSSRNAHFYADVRFFELALAGDQ